MRLRHAALPLLLVAACQSVHDVKDVARAPETTAAEVGDSPIAAELAEANAALDAIAALPAGERTFANTVRAIDDVVARTFNATQMTCFLSQVSTDPAERDRGRAADAAQGEWFLQLTKRKDLFEAVKAVAAQKVKRSPLDARLIQLLLRDFKREGMALPDGDRARLLEVDTELNDLGIEFSKNIADDETLVLLTPEETAGLPEDFLAGLTFEGGIYRIPVSGPNVIRLYTFAELESTRAKAVMARSVRGGKKNVEVLEKMLRLRHEKARLLGYANIAEYQTEARMAKEPESVWEFYEELRPNLRRKARQDFEEYQQAKRRHLGDPAATLQAWDVRFYKNRLLREKYAVDTEKVREYFPLEGVTQGLFDITQELFGVRYVDVTDRARRAGRPLWHEDVKLFEVWDQAEGDLLGEFYIDLHPREGKYTHAAQFPLVLRKQWADGDLTTTVVALVCNFTKPTGDKPALLSHDEVETYFHEFGHCLHSIFSKVPHSYYAGTSVARDFVEAPSQMLENWVWDAAVLKRFALHYDTGEPLPDDVLAGMIAAKNLGSGLDAEGQVFLGVMDMTYHTDDDGELDTTAVRSEVYADTRLFEPLHIHGQASFGHLVGYYAGYYGYLWSLVYAQDMFSRFAADGLMNPETGRAYRTEVLSRGGSVDELQMVRRFLGREPNSKAFLRHLGLQVGS